jgi:DNA-binding transcriptional regulator YhcF (GntR family)
MQKPVAPSSPILWASLFEQVSDSNLSLQGRIRQMIVSAILSGHLPPGSPVPSSRLLSTSLGIARNTVVFAYQQLQSEGYLESRERSGHFVAPDVLKGRVEETARHRPAGTAAFPGCLEPAPELPAFGPAQYRQARRLAETALPVRICPVRRLAVPHGGMARVLHQGAVGAGHPQLGARPDHQ